MNFLLAHKIKRMRKEGIWLGMNICNHQTSLELGTVSEWAPGS
jgi:hypothetical protein